MPTPLDADECYRALASRDGRFDGLFFVGVATTGIYCRPICTAKLAKRSSCTFYAGAAQAERAGFRACLRCRPERAPGHASVDARSALVRSALARIAAGALDHGSVAELAAALGVSDRHLRRTLEAEVGVTPIELAQTRRLGLAKWLIQDTSLPLAEVAFASGFASIRRFNAAFVGRFGRTPTELRRHDAESTPGRDLVLRLEARAPFAGRELLRFLQGRAIPSIETITDSTYERLVFMGDASGLVRVALDETRPGIVVRLETALLPHLVELVARLRALFDLDARPDRIDAHLGSDPALAASVARVPGMRVPGAFDAWELAVRTILGQQVSVRGATTLSARLVAEFGTSVASAHARAVPARRFPSAERLAQLEPEVVARIGLPRARAATIIALASRIADGSIDLNRSADASTTIAALRAIRGIGPWTAHYIALRALRDPDLFLESDLAAMKALGVGRPKEAALVSARWKPWRAYALMHVWDSLSRTVDDMIEPDFAATPRSPGSKRVKASRNDDSACAPAPMRSAVLPCSLGLVIVAASPLGISMIALGDDEAALREYVRVRFPEFQHEGADDALARDARRIARSFDPPGPSAPDAPDAPGSPDAVQALLSGGDIVLDVRGTPFQLRVWEALRAIPRGETTTYAALAARIGSKGAVRAVGTACGKNPMAVLIPCHRVLRGDGSLGGFRWGLERKRELLRREGRDGLRAPAPASRP